VFERHYSLAQLAVAWNLSEDTLRRIFLREPGVLIISNQRRRTRTYKTLRIPESVAQRVYLRLANGIRTAASGSYHAPGFASAMHRNSHRGLITGDTHSLAKVSHGAVCKPFVRKWFRASTTTPRPAAVAAGKINSLTTHLRNLVVVSASRPVTGRFGFTRHIGVGSPIDFPRRLRGASTLRLLLDPRLYCEPRRAGFRLRLRLGSGSGWWMRWWWIDAESKAMISGNQKSGIKNGFLSVVPQVESTRGDERAPVVGVRMT
jgi:hypothetical protein